MFPNVLVRSVSAGGGWGGRGNTAVLIHHVTPGGTGLRSGPGVWWVGVYGGGGVLSGVGYLPQC